MKKIISLFVIFALAACMLVSCANIATTPNPAQGTPKTYTVLETDMSSDSNIGAKHSVEFKLNFSDIKDNSKKDITKEITFENMTFTGKYQYTSQSPYYNRSFDKYKGNYGSAQVEFSINTETKELLGYSLYDKEYLQKIGDKKELTKEECIDIARNYFKNYISDIENYKMTCSEYVKLDAYKGMYRINFYRYVDEVITLDSALINVTVYGDVIRFSRHNLGDMKDVDILGNHSMNNIEKAVEEKRNEIYGELAKNSAYDVDYYSSKRLIRLADGKYALEYTIEAHITNVNSGISSGDSTSLIVYLE